MARRMHYLLRALCTCRPAQVQDVACRPYLPKGCVVFLLNAEKDTGSREEEFSGMMIDAVGVTAWYLSRIGGVHYARLRGEGPTRNTCSGH